MSNLFKKRNWEDGQGNKYTIRVREDGYVCATDMAEATNNRLKNFERSQETKETLIALSIHHNMNIAKTGVLSHIRDNTTNIDSKKLQDYLIEVKTIDGKKTTWYHEDLAIAYAYSCNVAFRLWVIGVIKDVIKEGKYKHQGYQYGNKVLPFETEIPQAYRGLGDGAMRWEKTFPDEFYNEIYRLWRITKPEPFKNHPQCFAKITTMLIYNEIFSIAPYTLRNELALLRCKDAELRASITADDGSNGKGFSKLLHQYLSEEGRNQLKRCLMTMLVIMRMSGSVHGLRDNLLKYHGQLDFLSVPA